MFDKAIYGRVDSRADEPDDLTGLCSRQQAIRRARVSRETMRKYIKAGTVDVVRVDGLVFITVESVDRVAVPVQRRRRVRAT